jgi:hypothetical protein
MLISHHEQLQTFDLLYVIEALLDLRCSFFDGSGDLAYVVV